MEKHYSFLCRNRPTMKHYDLSLLTVQYYDLSQILLIVPYPACVFIFGQYSQRTEVWPRLPPSIIGISDFLIVLNARYKFKFPSILQFQLYLDSTIFQKIYSSYGSKNIAYQTSCLFKRIVTNSNALLLINDK